MVAMYNIMGRQVGSHYVCHHTPCLLGQAYLAQKAKESKEMAINNS